MGNKFTVPREVTERVTYLQLVSIMIYTEGAFTKEELKGLFNNIMSIGRKGNIGVQVMAVLKKNTSWIDKLLRGDETIGGETRKKCH